MGCTLASIIDLLRLLTRHPLVGFMPYCVFLAGSLVCQVVALYFALAAFVLLRRPATAGADPEMADGGRYSQFEAEAPQQQSLENSRQNQTRTDVAASSAS